jgi:glutathionylspermidine synthase
LDGYSDSDLAGDVDSKKSTSRVFFFMCDSAMSWQSTKQIVVALSSCEAEYIAASTAACHGVWLARLLGEILKADAARPVIRIDNKSAISLVRNPVHHDRSKHIDVRFHFL